MKLIIAEKPNVQKELKAALEPSAQFIKTKGASYFKGKKFIFACSLGHIVVQKLPKEINEAYGDLHTFENLPYPIRPIPMRVGDAPANVYYNTLRDIILNETYDEIIVATDPDREGQGIYERIKQHMKGFPKNIKESRIWIKEWTPEGLKEAYANREPNAKYQNLGDAAECRAYDDYCFGMNGTAACTAQFQKFLSVGRVQTAVTAIVVARENEIQNFVPEKYKALSLVVGSDEPGKSLTMKHKTEARLSAQEASALYGKLIACRSVQLDVSQKEISERPKKLAGQTDFLQVMNKKYGYDAERTSDLLQTLYQDKKLTTYPGTEAHEISESAAKQALQPLRNLVGKVSSEIDTLIQKVFDNKWNIAKHCVTSKDLPHEAITPVFGSVKAEVIQGLTEAERNCYLEVIKRYLQAFYPPAVFHKTEVSTVAAGETFTASGKVLISEGYLAVIGRKEKEDDDGVIPHVTNNKRYPVLEVKNEDKVTKPPARYTEDTLLDAMKHAGRFVEDKHYADILKLDEVEGIGTGRTRPVILKTLKARGYYTVVKKAICASQKAMELIALLPKDIMLTSPVMTAMLEEDLKLVAEGKKSKAQHMDETDQKVREMLESIRRVEGQISAFADVNVLGTCPKCGGQMIAGDKNVYCSNWKTGCKSGFRRQFLETKFTDNDLKKLFNRQTVTKTLKKDGKSWKQEMRLNENFELVFVKQVEGAHCPVCGGVIRITDKYFLCEHYKKPDCTFLISKECFGGKITQADVTKIADGKRVKKKLKSKVGKDYEGYLVWKDNRLQVEFK